MSTTIIGKDGVYNFFSSISDAPLFESGLTKKHVEEYIREEFGNQGIKNLTKRLERVAKKGTSSYVEESLEDDISIFLSNNNLSLGAFINKYLTIKIA